MALTDKKKWKCITAFSPLCDWICISGNEFHPTVGSAKISFNVSHYYNSSVSVMDSE